MKEDPAGSRARRQRAWQGGAAVILGSAVPLFCAAASRPVPLGVIVGSLGIGAVAYGLLELLGSFDTHPRDKVVASTHARRLLPALLQAASAVVLLIVLLRLAVAGVLPLQVPLLAVSVPALFLWLTVAIGQAVSKLGVFSASVGGQRQHLWQHQGFWIIAASSVLYLPLLGSFGLVDCWETHYGEVAREMLARRDWISLWWGDEGWFWSKPILNFWVQGLSFSALGVEYAPDGMIQAISKGRWPQPEWAARLPMFSMALVGQYLLYKGAAQYFGRRAALLGGLILLTCPFWYFLARQSISDMPYVGPLSAAMGLLLLALRAEDTEQAKVYEVRLGGRTLALSGFHLLFGVIIALSSSQILYLIAQNFTVDISGPDLGLRWHLDEVRSGSPGNCGLPGNATCQVDPHATRARFQPAYLGLLWAGALASLLWLERGERRLKRLYYLAAWLFVALSFMAKGAPGFVLPVATFALLLLATNRLGEIRRAELLGFSLVLASVALPWFVQQYARHGTIFFDQLFTHHMYNRAFAHLHDTNAGDDTSFRYYIWQLGYGLFPWSGIVALGNLWCLGRSFAAPAQSPAEIRFRDATYLFVLWELTTFGMFSITGTKFHHYILPLVPAAAMLGGVLLNELLGSKRDSIRSARREWLTVGGLCLCCLLLVYGLAQLFPGAASGETAAVDSSASRALGICASVIGAGGALLLLLAGRDTTTSRSSSSVLMGCVGLASAVIVALVGRDLIVSKAGNVPGPARLIHLFIYKYDRPWPDALDFRNVLWAFTLVAALTCLLLMVARWRRQLTFALCFVAVLCSAWAVDVYLIETAPHLGQRVTVSEYYRLRGSPEEPLVAYQLNWKGENFYTSNHVPTFKSSGKSFKEWVKLQKDNGVRVMFFTTEHPRITTLKRELGTVSQFELITDKSVNAQFVLARVVL